VPTASAWDELWTCPKEESTEGTTQSQSKARHQSKRGNLLATRSVEVPTRAKDPCFGLMDKDPCVRSSEETRRSEHGTLRQKRRTGVVPTKKKTRVACVADKKGTDVRLQQTKKTKTSSTNKPTTMREFWIGANARRTNDPGRCS